ncbi:H-type small acid-soluble spore protein [Oceanobacillus salinisoli]|uniref:H-type small acid-soluble spore protein n=1 Tax=Oceanobacillus salinisoli TaxID=2678611 RepID=UPI0012E329AA|nr:H-type small acid-soluble spore protein [Oceanobacillus salinisoli]
MDMQRAKEIVQSQQLTPVNYNGRFVYIQQVDEQKEVAKVFPLDNLNSELSVELHSLDENIY